MCSRWDFAEVYRQLTVEKKVVSRIRKNTGDAAGTKIWGKGSPFLPLFASLEK